MVVSEIYLFIHLFILAIELYVFSALKWIFKAVWTSAHNLCLRAYGEKAMFDT